MSESKFTPGPWKIIGLESKGYGDPKFVTNEIECEDGRIVASVIHDSFDEHMQNAKLIAAAPCLLKELTVIRETLPHVGLDAATRVEMLRRIDAVIAKATA